MILGKGFLLFLLITTLSAAPQGSRQEPAGEDPPPPDPASGTTVDPAAPGTPVDPAASATPVDPAASGIPTGSKPSQQSGSSTTIKPATDEDSDEVFTNSWTCLLEAAKDLCSYLFDWTGSNKVPNVNLFSVFQGSSSEESSATSENSNAPGSALLNLFRFRRSVSGGSPVDITPVQAVSIKDVPGMSASVGVPVEGSPVEGVPVEEEAFLDVLHSFYLKMRDRFMRENPGSISPSTTDLYKRPGELAEVAAYVLGVPKDKLVQDYGKLRSKETGDVLLRALDDRMAMLNGEQRTAKIKSIGGLSPTSVSYFFQEFLATISGIATGISELFAIALQNEIQQTQPNLVN